ncbi:TPA: efflux RND transporter outer membrane protein VpoC [Vibrio parahaemolyticus]|uniref:Efflux RND transporter outer membrane protein VpoC n=2 Tax=Vibrio parahaemolyticus TaxID=670 RepID=A0AA46UIB2_VIBPH|nr:MULTISPECIES: efflux RND transporter outer membrane protein VpoC [Vibrio]EGQ9465971.1 efflux RND transporter outer membrane protein VpoC [Vibrio parahaemolyticus]EGR0033043.1 efflux RND transporter outer membrane protein VpoC [Vibrio parahaemolyticus]EGR0202009.1 efflux RND transporter outer membrane protein VpoC [Vibrio parahaemolyticus]EGR2290232.1 outer membrane channel protein TolC [Vibrio parahaemolyticus]EGR9081847.1 efflux RND transporter outer membrane protein VpoC [Vibrio parahaemo
MKKLLPLFISAALGGISSSAWADSLAEIYDLAKQNDPQLLSVAAQRDRAFEAITSSRSALLPQINLTAGYNLTRGDTDYDDSALGKSSNDQDALTAGVSFSQTLYNRASWISLDTAEKSARQADATYAATQQGLILRVSQAYFEVLRAQDNLVFVRAEKAAVGRQLEQTKQRFEVGLSAITDVHDAQAQYDAVLADEVLAENDLINSYESLREITGQEHKNLNVLDTNRFSATRTSSPAETLIEEAKTKNLSLLSARISQDIARDNISLASSGHLPTLSLDGGYNYGDTSNSARDNTTDNFNIGVNLAVPLYTGGNVTSQTKQAEFAYVAASEDLEAQYRSVVKDVRAQNNNINASIGALKAYEQSVVSARSALEATEAGFDVGTRTIVDVLDATRRLYDANKNLSDARYNYILSVLQLRQAVGTLSEQDILDVDAGLKPAK